MAKRLEGKDFKLAFTQETQDRLKVALQEMFDQFKEWIKEGKIL